MRHHRQLVALSLAVLFFATAPSGLTPQAVPTADAALKGVKDKFAPDTRVAVFDVTAERRGETVVVKGEVGDPTARDAALAAVAAAGHADIVDQITVLPDPALGAETWGVVTVSVAHVRGKPSHSAEQVTEVPMGAVAKLLKRQGSWYYAQTETENYLGFFEESHVAAMSRAGIDAWNRAPRLMTTALFAVVRERPATDAPPVCDLVAGSVLKAGPTQSGWSAVELPDGRKGFVERANVQDYDAWRQSRRLTPETIEKTALQFMGVPYLWGGTSPKGFDCSGFTKTVYRLNGVEIARDTDQQADQGKTVSFEKDFSQLKKGDLLFFCPSATRRDRITHVGIYLGDGVFIHCSGLVKRNSLIAGSPIYSENLLKRLVRVRRFVTDTATP
jgi:gamma-D-glutamyl-L-lysine dipeptidyl-peptidase